MSDLTQQVRGGVVNSLYEMCQFSFIRTNYGNKFRPWWIMPLKLELHLCEEQHMQEVFNVGVDMKVARAFQPLRTNCGNEPNTKL